MLQTILTIISLTGNYLNCRRIRACFIVWIICNIGWTAVDIINTAYSRAVLDVVQIGFSIYGFVMWRDKNGKNG